MTDKEQIIDKCKTCDVEPPAMKFKCPECEHNSDKEQIIIDGVDVSECLFYQSNFEEDYDVKIKHFCSNWHNSCESINNSNCYFKQQARSQARVKELEQKLKWYDHYKSSALFNKDLCNEKTDEIEKLQLKLKIAEKALFTISHVSYSGSAKEVEGYYRGIVNEALQKMKEVNRC